MGATQRRVLWAVAALTVGLDFGCTPGPIEVATLPSGGLTNGLVAHWTFDEGTGMAVNDSSGNGRDGTLFGTGWSWTAGRFGSAVHFSGQSGMDDVTVPGLPQATESYSVAAWLFLASSEIGPGTGTSAIANLLNTEIAGGGWALYATLTPGTAGYDFRYWTGGMAQYEMSPANYCNCLIFDTWVHLAAVVDATASTLTFYRDGAPLASVPSRGAISSGATTLYMARAQAPGFSLTGALDDVAIYSRALVAEEVATLAQAPAPDPH